MRLIHVEVLDEHGEAVDHTKFVNESLSLTLVEFFEEDVPPYAILSHTWEEEEVSFALFGSQQAQSMKGHAKIESCCRQAYRDGLCYVWVDTCNIDKSSSAELSEAINSMYRWYSASNVCYAYLSDVTEETFDTFTSSRWLTRGWTLQELIAPSEVVFFDAHWRRLKTRQNLAETIAKATNIDSALLSRFSSNTVNDYSVAQRMSWASRRTTTRTEDRAYSLLGIFGINMPLLYGEGTKAFLRLQQEIVRSSPDQSLLAWGMQKGQDHWWRPSINLTAAESPGKRHPLFAESPSDFAHCNSIQLISSLDERQVEYTVTNQGLRIALPVVSISPLFSGVFERDYRCVAILACKDRRNGAYLGIPLSPKEHNNDSVLIRVHSYTRGERLWTISVHPEALAHANLTELTITYGQEELKAKSRATSFRYWSVLMDVGPLSRYGCELVHTAHIRYPCDADPHAKDITPVVDMIPRHVPNSTSGASTAQALQDLEKAPTTIIAAASSELEVDAFHPNFDHSHFAAIFKIRDLAIVLPENKKSKLLVVLVRHLLLKHPEVAHFALDESAPWESQLVDRMSKAVRKKNPRPVNWSSHGTSAHVLCWHGLEVRISVSRADILDQPRLHLHFDVRPMPRELREQRIDTRI